MKILPFRLISAAWTVVAMGLVIAFPASLTLLRVADPGSLRVSSPDPTPYGYTWSLSLFIVPFTVLALWFHRRKDLVLQGRAYWRAVPILTATGFSLDILFGSEFLRFCNPAATLGWRVPVFGGRVPVEEFVFYLLGFMVVLMTYIWCDECWVARYNDQDYSQGLARVGRLARFHWSSLWFGIACIVLAVIAKKMIFHEEGLPSYLIFLIVASLIPSIGLFESVQPYINWRAFSITFFFILLVSLLWEVTLAIPYRWWGYQDRAMVGLKIGAWSNLPIEAVLVWLAVTYTTVIVYEVVKIWQASGETARKAFLAKGGSKARSRDSNEAPTP